MVHSQKGTVVAALIAPLFVLTFPIIDVTLAILRRGLKGMPIFRPDCRHLHHRLAQCGLSRTRIVLMLYGFSLFFLALGLGVFISKGAWLPLIFGVSCVALLISARSFEFSREWLSFGKVLSNTQMVRKQTRYALALQRWLELESERKIMPHELWDDFTFVGQKLGFGEVTLSATGSQLVWLNPSFGPDVPFPYQRRFIIRCGVLLDVSAPEGFGAEAFEFLSEIAADSWVKATERWEACSKMRFSVRSALLVSSDKKVSSRDSITTTSSQRRGSIVNDARSLGSQKATSPAV